MAKQFFAAMAILGVVLMSVPVSLFAQAQQTGVINGTAMGPKGEVLANTRVQLRDVKTKQLVGTTTTNAQGRYEFTNLPPSDYVVEILDQKGAIIGTTAVVSLTAGAMIAAGVGVTATAAGAIAAGAAAAGAGAAGAAAAAGGVGAFFGTTVGIVAAAAAATAGAVVAVQAAQDDASPSR